MLPDIRHNLLQPNQTSCFENVCQLVFHKKKDQVCFRIPILCGMATNASSSQVKTLRDSFRQGTVCKNVMCICVCSAFNSNRLCAENNHNLLRRTVPTASSRQLNDMIPGMTCRDVVFYFLLGSQWHQNCENMLN
jgi:hypothetical protein